jgi:hypothetical protein
MESEREIHYQFNIVIHSFKILIGDPECSLSQKAREIIFNQPYKFDNGFQLQGSDPPEPLFEMGLGSFFLKVIPKPLELILEVVNSDDGKVKFKHIRESSVFFESKVLGTLSQDEVNPSENDPLLMSHPSNLRSSSFKYYTT